MLQTSNEKAVKGKLGENFTADYLIRNGYDVREIQVEMKERETGVSYFHNPFKSLYFMLAEVLSIIFVQ